MKADVNLNLHEEMKDTEIVTEWINIDFLAYYLNYFKR